MNNVVLSDFYVLCSPPIILRSARSSRWWSYEDVVSTIVTTTALSSTSVSPIAWETWCAHLVLILFPPEDDWRAFPAVFHRHMQSSLWLISFLLTELKLLESISPRAEKPRSSVILMTGPVIKFQTFSPQEFICWVFGFFYLIVKLCQGQSLKYSLSLFVNGRCVECEFRRLVGRLWGLLLLNRKCPHGKDIVFMSLFNRNEILYG